MQDVCANGRQRKLLANMLKNLAQMPGGWPVFDMAVHRVPEEHRADIIRRATGLEIEQFAPSTPPDAAGPAEVSI